MKKILLLLLVSGLCLPLVAQEDVLTLDPGASIINEDGSEQYVGLSSSHSSNPQPEAMWDVQFDYAIGDSAGINGQAAAIFFNNQFWTSRWQNDTLHRYDNTGSHLGRFMVKLASSTISGIRAFSHDGVNIYAANNSATLYQIDPATDSVIATIPTNTGFNVRFAAYDSTADGGNGGFWCGNFNTDIVLVSMSGATLSTIPALTHGLGGMYGAVVDNFSTGGPYLWVFHQPGTPSDGVISQLHLPAGNQSGLQFDVDSDLPLTSGGLAGGIFISDDIVSGQVTLGGLLQDGPNRLFGYELDYIPIDVDVALQSMAPTHRYTQIPIEMVTSSFFEGDIRQNGVQVVSSVDVDLDVSWGGSSVFSGNQTFSNMQPAATNTYSIGPFTPGALGDYIVNANVTTGAQMDEDPTNNSASYFYSVTDTTLARDDGNHNGSNGYIVSSSNTGAAIAIYDFPVSVYLKGVEIEIENPQAGETTFPILINASSGQPSGGPIATNAPTTINAGQNLYYLPFANPVFLSAGFHGIGVFEDVSGIFLRQSANVFTPGINYFTTDLNNWQWNASGVTTTRFIRPVIATCAFFGLNGTSTPDNGTNNGTATVNISGGNGGYSYFWSDPGAQTTQTATGLATGTYTVTVVDQTGCQESVTVGVESNVGIEDLISSGLLDLTIFPNPSSDRFQVKMAFSQPRDAYVRVHSLSGQQLMERYLETALESSLEIDLSTYPDGFYLLEVQSQQGSAFQRLVKIH